MNILLAVHHFPPQRVAGAEQLAYRLARGLLQRGHQVQVVCMDANTVAQGARALKWSDELYDEIPVRRLSFDLARSPDPLKWSFENPLFQAHFVELLTARHVDLLHLISGYLLGFAPLRAARQMQVPTIVTLTDFWFLCPTIQLLRGDGSLCPGPEPTECARCLSDRRRAHRFVDQHAPTLTKKFWRAVADHPTLGETLGLSDELVTLEERRRMLRNELNRADALASPTQFVAALHARNGVDTTRVHYTPYSVEVTTPVAARTAVSPIRFGFLGQVVPVKGIDLLIRAFRQLDRTRTHARLSIHGGLDADVKHARALQRLAHNDPDIEFAGDYRNQELPKVLNDLDVVVVPSRWYENSPHVVLEAFAARRPVIGTNVGGISEVVQHEVNGLLFERGNAADLARQMQRVLDEPDLLPHLRTRIAPARTPDAEMDDLLEVYSHTIAKRRAAPVRSHKEHV